MAANETQQALPSEFNTCDNCRHGEHMPDGNTVCFGAPPSVVLMAARPNPIVGQPPQFQFNNMRPVMPPKSRACALFESSVKMIGAS